MSNALPIWIIEPDQSDKRELAALKLSRGGQKSARIPHAASVPELKVKIKQIREAARENIDSLVMNFSNVVKSRYPEAKVEFALDNKAALEYVTRIAGDTRVISANNSAAVNDLKNSLINNGFVFINSYHHEFTVKEKKILDYWDLPRLLESNIEGTFSVVLKREGLPERESLKYIALLGINAASAKDGSVIFLEHFSNIKRDLEKAEKVVLVIGLDKIVATRDEAVFQTQCMGIFGAENILLGVAPQGTQIPSIEDLHLPEGIKTRELHILVLDNGLSKLARDKYKDLFLCIGCRACNLHCPIRFAFNTDYIWTPKNYLTHFLAGVTDSVDVCLHCEACRLECPLDIDIPYLLWQAKLDYLTRHSTSFSHQILGRPEVLAKLGTAVAPVSNWAMSLPLVRVPMEKVTGIDRRTRLPRFHKKTFRKSINK